MRVLGETLTSTYQWLSHLKSSQLKNIAHVTGIPTAGPKLALALRLQRELPQCEYLPPELGASIEPDSSARRSAGQNGVQSEMDRDRGKGNLSILSIDMGIQNLAFAHLLVPGPAMRKNGSSRFTASGSPIPTLTAWHRLAVSAFPRSSTLGLSSLPLSTFPLSQSRPRKQKVRREDESTQPQPSSDEGAAIATGSAEEDDKFSFAPDLYAEHAYTLITSLLATYKPTHILIERQRFRSGGASAVQEWTLRVGVFEGMLYAVLHTLARERGYSIFVQGVEPSRVARYWYGDGENDVIQEKGGSETTKKKRMTSKEGKKAKIDLVGKWLCACEAGDENINDGVTKISSTEGQKIDVAPDDNVRRVVNSYLRKWQGKKTTKSRSAVSSDEGSKSDIGKLDDLADCLLQGVTWLDWHVARAEILRHGADASVVRDIILNTGSAKTA
ncbi:conserved hypothetical protein [Paecilomyces variotii No. 5]|uniref:SAP domain-containing protein n=1 Tax=Byssochlamys spectabilis (strain No. 5 / NBRC 109023) TaxID=1356009 RepID=V5FA76_BYSSN|nr:conserved hypothetical protein [Paecilomyces variotii No. 5]